MNLVFRSFESKFLLSGATYASLGAVHGAFGIARSCFIFDWQCKIKKKISNPQVCKLLKMIIVQLLYSFCTKKSFVEKSLYKSCTSMYKAVGSGDDQAVAGDGSLESLFRDVGAYLFVDGSNDFGVR